MPLPSSTTTSIHSTWARVHSEKGLPFPEAASALLALGVSRYHINYTTNTGTTYLPDAQTSTTFVDVADIPANAAKLGQWNKHALVSAIRYAQSAPPDYTYEEFERRCIEAGVVEYHAYLEGKRVVYLGAMGDLHVEWFPGAGLGDE